MQNIQNLGLFSLHFVDNARAVGMPSRERKQVLRAFWFLVLLLGVRGWVNCVFLEPYNDEGLWLWNARCQTWALPDGGILHAALSPVSYYLYSLLFKIVPVTWVAIRIFQWTTLFISIVLAFRLLIKRNALAGAWIFLAWLLTDPTFFRVSAWAILEPLLCASVLFLSVYFERCQRNGKLPSVILWGAALGVLLALKMTMIWMLFGWLGFEILSKQWKRAVQILVTALIVSIGFYYSIYQTFDKVRFWEVWHLHSALRGMTFIPFGGFPPLARHFLPHYSMILVLALGLSFLVRKNLRGRNLFDPFVIGCGLGFLLLVTQAYSPTRYYLPLVMLTLFQCSLWMSGTATKFKPKILVLVIVAGLVNAVAFREYVFKPKNFGGRTLRDTLATAVREGKTIAAPPSLALSFRYAIQPTSVGPLANRPLRKYLPDLYIYQGTAAQPTRLDKAFIAELKRAHFNPVEIGQFQVFDAKKGSRVAKDLFSRKPGYRPADRPSYRD